MEFDGVSFTYPRADEVSLASLETVARVEKRENGEGASHPPKVDQLHGIGQSVFPLATRPELALGFSATLYVIAFVLILTGLLAEPGNVDHLVKAIVLLNDDPALARRLARAGREWVEEKFDIHHCLQPLIAHFQRHLTSIEAPTGARRLDPSAV